MAISVQYVTPIGDCVDSCSSNTSTFSIGTDKIIIGSETFETEQLAQLLKLLLKEHPELQI